MSNPLTIQLPPNKRLWNGGKKATFKMGEHFTEENLWGKMAFAFLEGFTDED